MLEKLSIYFGTSAFSEKESTSLTWIELASSERDCEVTDINFIIIYKAKSLTLCKLICNEHFQNQTTFNIDLWIFSQAVFIFYVLKRAILRKRISSYFLNE